MRARRGRSRRHRLLRRDLPGVVARKEKNIDEHERPAVDELAKAFPAEPPTICRGCTASADRCGARRWHPRRRLPHRGHARSARCCWPRPTPAWSASPSTVEDHDDRPAIPRRSDQPPHPARARPTRRGGSGSSTSTSPDGGSVSTCRWTGSLARGFRRTVADRTCRTSATDGPPATRPSPSSPAIRRRCAPSARPAPPTPCPSSCPAIAWCAPTAHWAVTSAVSTRSASCSPWRHAHEHREERRIAMRRRSTPSDTRAAPSWQARVDAVDWTAVGRGLDEYGCALTGPLLNADEAAAIASLYGDASRFRSTVNMRRHRFGEGEYRYFGRTAAGSRRRVEAAPLSAAAADRARLVDQAACATRRGRTTWTTGYEHATPPGRPGRPRSSSSTGG